MIGIIVLIVLVLVFYFMSSNGVMDDEAIVRDAFLGTGSASCTFIEPETGGEIDMFFKAGKLKISGLENGHQFFLISKDNTVYTWNSLEEQGVRFSVEESEEMGSSLDFGDKEKFIEETKDYIVECSQTPLNDSIFDLPEDIEFYDISKMFPTDFDIKDLEIDVEGLDDLEF